MENDFQTWYNENKESEHLWDRYNSYLHDAVETPLSFKQWARTVFEDCGETLS